MIPKLGVAVRDKLDVARLVDWVTAQRGVAPKAVAVAQFRGGSSNLTYGLDWDEARWVLRCPPPGGAIAGGHDVLREARLLTRLAEALPWAPRPVLVSADDAVLGVPFYVMERLDGLILRRDAPEGVTLDMRAVSEALVRALVELHALDPAALGLADFGKPAGYVARQVAGWTRRLAAAKTGEHAALDQVAAWLATHLPPEGPACLLHNDFKLDNVVLDPADPTRIVGILDWEMAALGDPWTDVGTSLAYWVEAQDPAPMQALRFGPTHLPGAFTRAEWLARYAALSGRDPGDVRFYQVLGLFKVAVVGQQLFARHAAGKSQDARFATLDQAVAALAGQARALIG